MSVFPIKDGLRHIVDRVREDLAANGVTANVAIGWLQSRQQINQGPGGANRVVFIPGDENGDGGPLSAAKLPGPRAIVDPNGDPEKAVAFVRALRNWDRSIVVAVWANDENAGEDEAAQYEATVALLEEVLRAVQRVAPVAFQWGKTRWAQPQERSFGRELRVSATVSYPLFDRPEPVAYPENIAITRTGHIDNEEEEA